MTRQQKNWRKHIGFDDLDPLAKAWWRFWWAADLHRSQEQHGSGYINFHSVRASNLKDQAP